MLQAHIFRENDIRGVAETELTDEGIRQLGQALGTFARRKNANLFSIGRDTRLSSPRLHAALSAGLLSTWIDVIDIGVVPTPLLYYSVFRYPTDGGVMITGSHNPADYNGFKIMMGQATLHGDGIRELRRLIEEQDFERGAGAMREVDVVSPYVEEVASQFRWSRKIRVVFDAGNGVAGPVMRRLNERLSIEATELFFDMDGRFPNHHPDPTVPENLEALIEEVRTGRADLGIAFDGDSDRIGAVDDQGRVVYGDQLMILYSRAILKQNPGASIIGEVKCSQSLYDDITKHGGRGIMWKTGHALIKAKMKEEHALLAGEMSGHMFFADRYYGFDDALYAACRLMEIVAESDGGLANLLADVPQTVTTPELRVDCPDDAKFDVVRRVRSHFQSRYPTNDVDGARVSFPAGWGLVRASNTQPVLVLRFEALNEDLLKQYRGEVEQVVEKARDLVAGARQVAG